jgi:hypothetical protein
LGNGLRVVAGAVLATNGELSVATRGSLYRLHLNDDGTTIAKRLGPYKAKGTRIDVKLGDDSGPPGGFFEASLRWARRAILFAGKGTGYKRGTSAHWYDSDAFFELLQAAPDVTVRELVSEFEGCTGAKAGKIASRFLGQPCSSLGRDDAERLLATLRQHTRPVNPSRLGTVGRPGEFPEAYARVIGSFTMKPSRGKLAATLPFVAEAWARPAEMSNVLLTINRTSTTASLDAFHKKTDLYLAGCGLDTSVTVGKANAEIWLNVDCPYMPITTDGKAPDLHPIADEIRTLVGRVAKKIRRQSKDSNTTTEKAVIEAHLDVAVAQASGDHEYRFSLRQLFYAVRPFIIDELGKEPTYENFTKVITAYEGHHGEIQGMYRDPRGVLYHPHLQVEIPIGTLTVETYERPSWVFNKVLYIEKEGYVSILRHARWAERHDCALLTSKGFASGAARDLLDLIGDTDEEVQVFAVHDADAAGTLIYQALQEETRARGRRNVRIVDLGLQPWEAVEMDLPVEQIESKGGRQRPVADYVLQREDGALWQEWLQHKRVELNAMTTPQFIDWLDEKMEQYGQTKLLPPRQVMTGALRQEVRDLVEKNVTEAIIKESQLPEKVAAALRQLRPEISRREAELVSAVERKLDTDPVLSWRGVVNEVARATVAAYKR